MIYERGCTDLEQQLYKQFLFMLENGSRGIVIVPDEATARKALSFFRARTEHTYRGTTLPRLTGICVETREKAGPIQGFSSIGHIYGYDRPATPAEEQVAVLITYLDEAKIGSGYWIERPIIEKAFPDHDKMLENETIREQFLDTFTLASKEIDIICPWINQYVVNEELISLMEAAIVRGVKIKVIYGIGEGSDSRSKTSERSVRSLDERFSIYPDSLRFKKDNTHIKLLLCDDRYMLTGSYNFLSFAGDYSSDDERKEAVECIVDPVTIAQRRQHYFDW